jgi:hypothetical protein
MAELVYERLAALAQNDPQEFRRVMASVRAKTVIPHAGQQKVLESKARFKVMNCGRRWGKTVLAAKMAVAAARKKNQMVWWVAPTYKITKRGYAEVLKQIPDGLLTHAAPPDTNFDAGRSVILRFRNGSRMEFYSAERPEGMLGAAVDFAVLDEAAIMPGRIWNQIVSPTLIDHLGKALMISTPRGRNWFYKAWLKGQDPQQTEWDSWTFTTQDNPTLPEGEADRMAADMPRMEADQEIFAKWLAAGSAVFTWEPRAEQDSIILENGMVDGVEPGGFVVLGIDLARTNDYTVLYGARMRDRRNCYFERMQAVTWPEQKRRIRRAVKSLRRAGAENVMLIMDSTGVGDPIVEDLEAEGYDVVGINFTTHKANMVRLLAKDLEEAEALVLKDAFLDEFRNYQMNVTPAGRFTYAAPEGENDDVVAAKMLQHWGIINEAFGEVTMLTSDGSMVGQSADSDDEEEYDDWSDLLDDDYAAAEAVGLRDSGHHRPTEQELLNNADLWF